MHPNRTINGEEIVTTDNHPFYVQGRGFINAGSLLVGDKLISVNGEDLFVEKHRVEEFDEPVDVYNFQVEDYHTYFVGDCAVNKLFYLTDIRFKNRFRCGFKRIRICIQLLYYTLI